MRNRASRFRRSTAFARMAFFLALVVIAMMTAGTLALEVFRALLVMR